MNYVVIVLLILSVVILLIALLFDIIEVDGESMLPTLTNGQYLWAFKLFRRDKIKRGDIVVYRSPLSGRHVIKRVVTVRQDSKGRLVEFYAMGDNRDNSFDSRNYGYVPRENLEDKVIKIKGVK